MKYLLTITLALSSLTVAQELPGWGVYLGGGLGSMVMEDEGEWTVGYEPSIPFIGSILILCPYALGIPNHRVSISNLSRICDSGSNRNGVLPRFSFIFAFCFKNVALLNPYHLFVHSGT